MLHVTHGGERRSPVKRNVNRVANVVLRRGREDKVDSRSSRACEVERNVAAHTVGVVGGGHTGGAAHRGCGVLGRIHVVEACHVPGPARIRQVERRS